MIDIIERKTASLLEYETSDEPFSMNKENFSEFQKFSKNQGIGDQDKERDKLILVDAIEHDGKVNFKVKATSYVGVFSIPGNGTLIVKPKIGTRAFVKMLDHVSADVFFQDIFVEGLSEEADFVEYFIKHFVKKTCDLLLNHKRKGYQIVKARLPHVKGKVNYTKLVQGTLSTLVECEFYRFDSNTPINQALKFTLMAMHHAMPV
nr:hypothetical protein [Candidatus Sigynarchaeota archaeon]